MTGVEYREFMREVADDIDLAERMGVPRRLFDGPELSTDYSSSMQTLGLWRERFHKLH